MINTLRPTYPTQGTCAQYNESESHNSSAMSTASHTLKLNDGMHAVSACLAEALHTFGSNEFEDSGNYLNEIILDCPPSDAMSIHSMTLNDTSAQGDEPNAILEHHHALSFEAAPVSELDNISTSDLQDIASFWCDILNKFDEEEKKEAKRARGTKLARERLAKLPEEVKLQKRRKRLIVTKKRLDNLSEEERAIETDKQKNYQRTYYLLSKASKDQAYYATLSNEKREENAKKAKKRLAGSTIAKFKRKCRNSTYYATLSDADKKTRVKNAKDRRTRRRASLEEANGGIVPK